MLPDKMPDEPVPATALPMMNAKELGATPQINDPSSNSSSAEERILGSV
jgi:hypothetical protein